jgi:hypothetical protein
MYLYLQRFILSFESSNSQFIFKVKPCVYYSLSSMTWWWMNHKKIDCVKKRGNAIW